MTDEENKAADQQMGVFLDQLTPQQRSELVRLYVDPTGIRNLLEWTLKAMEGKPELALALTRVKRHLDIFDNRGPAIQRYVDLFRKP